MFFHRLTYFQIFINYFTMGKNVRTKEKKAEKRAMDKKMAAGNANVSLANSKVRRWQLEILMLS